jgi:nucleoside-diphosphate-sugar epimerase
MKVIITGTTGMVGEGVLLECLANQQVTEVLSVSRKPIGLKHPELKEYIVSDFISLKENDENLKGYDACFFCAGVSSVGMKEPEYINITYNTTLTFAKALNPKQQMIFAFISGAGTDSSEKGRLMWARVKGKTENDLMKLPFKQVFAFRPGLMKFTQGQKNLSKTQKFMSWLYPAFNAVFPRTANTIRQLGQAMIYAAQNGYEKKVVEVSDIKILVDRAM